MPKLVKLKAKVKRRSNQCQTLYFEYLLLCLFTTVQRFLLSLPFALLSYMFMLSNIRFNLPPLPPTAILLGREAVITATKLLSVHEIKLPQDLVTIQNQGSLPLAQYLDLLRCLL
jgi:hypothetical protein